MAATPTPTVHNTIKVTSGRLCFGALHNIYAGASSATPVVGLPAPRPRAFGTVKTHPLQFNVPAQNGEWNAYRLIDLRDAKTTAWLLAHSPVDPRAEIDRILRVSGAPWDADSGSSFNNEDTQAAGVLVVNRYDWGYYQDQYHDEIGEGVDEGEHDILANANSLGIVDFDHAKDMVARWQAQKPSEREWSESGAWLYMPLGEYMFGRFGYDEATRMTAAQSFLYFSGTTEFTKTVFVGTETTIRKEETAAEWFERSLREGYDFSGIKSLRQRSTLPDQPDLPSMYPKRPDLERCFGPHDVEDRVLTAEDIEALRVYQPPRQNLPPELASSNPHVNGEFVEPWVEPVYDLLNELVLSYLEYKIVPRMANLDAAAAIEALFPHPRTDPSSMVDGYFYKCFEDPDEGSVPGFDYDAVTARIKSFLSKFEREDVVYHDECIAGICRVIARMLTEVLELAGMVGRDCARDKILPCDVRNGVYNVREVRGVLQFSMVFWEGRA